MNLDWAFSKTYNAHSYNCAHFVIEVWKRCLGLETNCLASFLTGPSNRSAHKDELRTLTRVCSPGDWDMALFQANRKTPHVGIYLSGRVLHLSENGARWEEVSTIMIAFNKVRFYRVEKN